MQGTVRPHPGHRQIARGVMWIAGFVLLGKLAGAIKEVAIAWRYGVGPEVDAYVFVFNLVNWPVSVWFSVISIVLVPLVASKKSSASPQARDHFRAELLGVSLLLASALLGLMWLTLPHLIKSSWARLPVQTLTHALEYFPMLVLLAPIGVLISLFSAWTMARGRQINTLLEGIPALVLACAILLPFSAPLIWGTVAGAAVHLAVIAMPRLQGARLDWPEFHLKAPEWAVFWKGMTVMAVGQAFMSLTVIIDQLFAAGLDAGTISSLSYSNRVLGLFLGLGATAVGRATLVIFSSRANSEHGQNDALARSWIGIMFFSGVVAAAIGWWLATGAIALLYERGAFTTADTDAVAAFLRIGLAQVPFYFSGLVLVSLLASRGRYQLIAIGAALNLLIKLGLNSLLTPMLGAEGILWATAIMYLCSFMMLLGFAKYSVLRN